VHATAYGRALMMDFSLADLKKLFPEGRLAAASAHTPRSLPGLAKLIEQDRARGLVVSESYFERNISAVVAPVRDHQGAVIAAVGITAQQPVFESQMRERLIHVVREAAGDLSHRMSYRPAEKVA
jgi:DNA-binding IclR family transcriptional regulator